MLTYVVPVMNRSKYIGLTIGSNLQLAEAYGAKILVLSYGDGEGVLELLRERHMASIESGLLTVCRYEGNGFYNRSHSTNLAWLAADTKYVVDIAAETKIHDAGARELAELIGEHDGKHPGEWWTFPFQVMTSQRFFVSLGGYDETFVGWGWEDSDLHGRVEASSAVEIPIINGPRRWTHINNKNRTSGFPSLFGDRQGTWRTNQSRARSRPFFQFANWRQLWGHGRVEVNRSHWLRLGAYTNTTSTSFRRAEYHLPADIVGEYQGTHRAWKKGDRVTIEGSGRFSKGGIDSGSWRYAEGCLTLMWDDDGHDHESLYQFAPGKLSSLCESFFLVRVG